MTIEARELLDAFDRLPDAARYEVAIEIIRRAGLADVAYPPLEDEDLDRIADEAFQDYDAREAAADGPG
jgi:hypothetical protein